MKKNLNILAPSVFIALTCLLLHTGQGMEDFSKFDEQSVKQPLVRGLNDLDTEEPQEKKRRKEIKFHIEQLPEEGIKLHILKYASIDSLDDGTIGKLSVVCKEWQSIIQRHKIEIFKFSICQIFSIDPETCERFLNGRLVYKPNKDNDIGKMELRISDLTNPLDGTFDLSRCGDADQYLRISTGYWKEKKAENADKVEIWLTPRFLAEKELNGSAKYFQKIFPDRWSAQASVGIIWTWGGWDHIYADYDYLTDQTIDELRNGNLYNKWNRDAQVNEWSGGIGNHDDALFHMEFFFMN